MITLLFLIALDLKLRELFEDEKTKQIKTEGNDKRNEGN